MKRLRWQLIIVLVALVAIALLLLSQQPNARQVIIVPEPVKGGVYNEALVGTPNRFNPTLDFYNSVDRDVDRLLFSGLIKFDDHGIPQGDLAESWGISKDGTSYNFALRANAFWHNGQPVTSDDVIFTVELLRHADYPVPDDLRTLWKSIDIKRLDDKNLQFRLSEPFSPFLDYLTFGILPKHLLVNLTPKEIIDAPFNLNPVGSGPYRLVRVLTRSDEGGQSVVSGVVLSSFDKFYTHSPYIDQFAFRFFPDSASALAAYKEGQVQGIGNVTLDILPQALADGKLNLYSSRLPRLAMILFNLDNPEVPFFTDGKVRQAFLTGINRQKIIDRILGGQAILASSPIFPGTWAYYEGVTPIAFDTDQAIDMLKQAGFTIPADGTVRTKENQKLSFELLYPDNETYAAIAQSIQQNWLNMQVDVILKPDSYDDMLNNYLQTRKYQAALVELNLSRSPDPDPYPFWHQTQAVGGQNFSQWQDRQASEYLEQARVTIDPEERRRLYRNFQVRFANELPALPLYYPVYTYAVSQEVQGVRIGPLFDPSDRLTMAADWFLIAKGKVAETLPAPSQP